MKILFVCHGNICRSVMAEMLMRHLAKQDGRKDLVVDSCATSTEEIGNDIYPPAKRCLDAHDVPYTRHAARQITLADYQKSDLILLMDYNNLRNLRYIFGQELLEEDAKKEKPKIRLLMSFVDRNNVCDEINRSSISANQDRFQEVADPWYTRDFEATYRDLLVACKAILSNVF